MGRVRNKPQSGVGRDWQEKIFVVFITSGCIALKRQTLPPLHDFNVYADRIRGDRGREELSGPGASNGDRVHHKVTTQILLLSGAKRVDTKHCGKPDC